MTKKEYMKPELQVIRIQHQCHILAGSVQTTGLGDGEELSQDENNPSGNSWDEAMGRRSIWDEEDEE